MKCHSYVRNKMLYTTDNKYKYFIPKSYRKKGFTEKDLFIPKM